MNEQVPSAPNVYALICNKAEQSMLCTIPHISVERVLVKAKLVALTSGMAAGRAVRAAVIAADALTLSVPSANLSSTICRIWRCGQKTIVRPNCSWALTMLYFRRAWQGMDCTVIASFFPRWGNKKTVFLGASSNLFVCSFQKGHLRSCGHLRLLGQPRPRAQAPQLQWGGRMKRF